VQRVFHDDFWFEWVCWLEVIRLIKRREAKGIAISSFALPYLLSILNSELGFSPTSLASICQLHES